MPTPLPTTKVKGALGSQGSDASKYFGLTYGPISRGAALLQEAVVALLGGVPGAAGLVLRRAFYRGFFAECGTKVTIGRNVTFRHACKIRLSDGVVIDDGALVDAKGDGNAGITLDDGVYIGRNSLVYCKGGNIRLERDVNLGASCTVFSSNDLTIGAGTMVGAYSYFLSGGEYDPEVAQPFCEQSGTLTKGPLTIGANCWVGARVTVLDAACVGEHCVLGAGAVVTKPIPPHSLVLGVPGRVVRVLPHPAAAQSASTQASTSPTLPAQASSPDSATRP